MASQTQNTTRLLNEWREGSCEAENELFALVLPNLRRLARYLMMSERRGPHAPGDGTGGSDLPSLVGSQESGLAESAAFFRYSRWGMHRGLIDHARTRLDAEFVPFEAIEELLSADSAKLDLASAVEGLVDRLAKSHPEWGSVVELKCFLGLTDEQAAGAVGVQLRTLKRMCQDARAVSV